MDEAIGFHGHAIIERPTTMYLIHTLYRIPIETCPVLFLSISFFCANILGL